MTLPKSSVAPNLKPKKEPAETVDASSLKRRKEAGRASKEALSAADSGQNSGSGRLKEGKESAPKYKWRIIKTDQERSEKSDKE